MSAHQLITDHLDLWTQAVTQKSTAGRGSNGKVELTGIKKLRALILELAVRGKLVEQDPNDEPASVLLEKISAEKNKRIERGKIKKPKKHPAIDDAELSFQIPVSWKFIRLGDAVDIIRGITFPASEKSNSPAAGRLACLRTTNVQDTIEVDDLLYIKESFVTKNSQYIQKNDIVMSMANSRELVGKVAFVEEQPEGPMTFGGFLGVLRPTLIHPKFLMAVLRAPHSRKTLIGNASQTTNIANISIGKLNPLVIGLPPLEEQHRIVQKVDELMALCDRLEQHTSDQLDAHETLVNTLLGCLLKPAEGSLTQFANATELADNWARLAEHFDTLFTTEQSIDKLKQAILQLAVMGRLVEQDAGDEPPIDFLTEIHTRKTALAKERRIKRPRPLTQMDDVEQSYPAPTHWAWASFQDIADDISTGPFGSMIHKHDYVEGGTPLINPSHMVGGRIKEDSSVTVPPAKAEDLSSYKLAAGDIVMARRGEVGRCAVVTNRETEWLCGTGSFVLRFHPAMNRRFILLMFATDTVREYLTGNSVGTTMWHDHVKLESRYLEENASCLAICRRTIPYRPKSR